MFQVYHSNSLLILKDLLVRLIDINPLDDPFQTEQILVQSPGMAQWLKLELAHSAGIAASVDFPLPASFIWRCFTNILPEVPERSAFNKEAMAWKLMLVLPDLLVQDEFSSLRRYLENDEHGYRLYQLSLKIADTFDQYLVYRPQWIDDWEQGGNMAANAQPWQPVLWRALVAYTADLGQSHWHRANMFGAFIKALAGNASDKSNLSLSHLPKRLFVFGISALPENYIQVLKALGQHIDVHLMVMNPCRYFWGDILDQKQIARINRQWFGKSELEFGDYAEGNPLLASMGKLGRDYLYQLQESSEDEITAFVELERHTILHAIQQDILDLDNPTVFPENPNSSQCKQVISHTDDSIVLHSCHSPLREIEVLHDQLLAMFEANPDLNPRDIIVMMPDVAGYAPYIDAVFANVPKSRYIPYSISDRTDKQENPVLLSFETLLNMKDSRFTVSDVLSVLEVPSILRRFGLDDEGFHVIRNWVDQANIRWGLDAQQRQLWDLPIFEQNTWLIGLKRMLVGYALGEQDRLWQDLAPFPEVEGLEAERLGKLCDFIDLLDSYRQCMSEPHHLTQWIEDINQLIERTYLPDEQDELALNMIRKTLQKLLEQHTDAKFDQPLSAQVMVDYLVEGMNSQRSSQRFMVGAVNFCTLMPMRSIPFKVVCLLGMNDGAYPRTIAPIGFDLMRDNPQRGDRSRRDDDRYLFLEALLSAQDRLYISYIGRSIKDNTEKVPSVLVSELMEYSKMGYVLDGDAALSYTDSADKLQHHLTIQHPLTPFSPRYFEMDEGLSADDNLFSYAEEWLPAAAPSGISAHDFMPLPLAPLQTATPSSAQSNTQMDDSTIIELDNLIRFLCHPSRYFFNHRLRVFFTIDEVDAQDEEPFSVHGLDEYILKQRYLDAALRGENIDVLDQVVQAQGVLPVGFAGQLKLSQLRFDCETLAEKIIPLKGDIDAQPQRLEVNIDLDGMRLQGWLSQCYPQHQLLYRPAHIQPKDRLTAWVKHLALCALDTSCQPAIAQTAVPRVTIYRGLSGKLHYRAVEPELARAELAKLVSIYQHGLNSALAFDPLAAETYVQQQAKDEEKTPAKVEAVYMGSVQRAGLASDPYIYRCFPTFNRFYASFSDLVEQIYTPMLPYVDETKGDSDDD